MKKLWRDLRVLARHEGGQGMVEYSLILTAVAVVVIAALSTISGPLNGIFAGIKEGLEKSASPKTS